MASGPVAGNHPRAYRRYVRGDDVLEVTPVQHSQWDRVASYVVTFNGEDRGEISYRRDRYTRGWYGYSHRPALVHFGSAQKWRGKGQVCLGAGGVTFKEAIANFPQAVRAGRMPTDAEADAELAEIDVQLATKEAQRELEAAEHDRKRKERAEAAERERGEVLEGLRSMRDNLGAGLTNQEAFALKAAIVRYGGSDLE